MCELARDQSGAAAESATAELSSEELEIDAELAMLKQQKGQRS